MAFEMGGGSSWLRIILVKGLVLVVLVVNLAHVTCLCYMEIC
jgi:hypothetical protein